MLSPAIATSFSNPEALRSKATDRRRTTTRGVQDDGVLAGVSGHRVRPPLRQHLVHDDGGEAVDHDGRRGPHGPALRHQHARRLPHGVHGDAPHLLQLLAAPLADLYAPETKVTPERARPTGVQGGVPRQLHRRLHRGGRHHPRRSDPSEHAEGGALRADLRRRLRLARLQPPHRRDARAPHRLPPPRLLLHRLLRLPRRRRVHAQAPDRPRHLRRRDHPLVARPRALGHGEAQRPRRRPQPARVDGEDPRADVGDDRRQEQLVAGHRPRRRAQPSARSRSRSRSRSRRSSRRSRTSRPPRRSTAPPSSTARCSSSSPTATT